jgi:pantoate--beta-alanine ligase
MRTVERILDVRRLVRAERARGRKIGFVPTMGFLHDGHLALADEAKRRAEFVVMSIFVNPLQFAPTEDLARYPRDPEGDAAKASRHGVDLLFAPPLSEMYRNGDAQAGEVIVVPRSLDQRWEGAVRPGHFTGVLTVVAKLFNIVQPDIALFGQKDFQQATLIRAMARDLDMPVEIVVGPTVREADGLAMSSRNTYLSAEDRRRALRLSQALRAMQDAFAAGTRDVGALERTGRSVLERDAAIAVDYLAVVDAEHLQPSSAAAATDVAIVAARVGSTRLIDNAALGGPMVPASPAPRATT